MMKTKYLQKNTSPHLGKLLKAHIIKHSVYRSSLSRYMERQPSTIEYYLKQPTLQTALLWELSTALKHNFFKDLAAQLPADFTTNAPDTTLPFQERIAALEEEAKLTNAKLEELRAVVRK
ncbi:hypothetical protein [Aequorivita sp. Q41]|uniref:hypothetical protein n=1 Tax=Aequorivita sp. Q41 TaxID=3153300 RepID=UPI00324259AD